VFIEQGMEGARMADIARRAGVAEGTVYLYYPAKQALLEAVVAEFWVRLTEEARRAVDPSIDTFEQLRAFAAYHLDVIMDNIEFIDLTAVLRTSTSETIGSRDLVRAYIAVFDDILQRGTDRGDLQSDTPRWILRDLFSGSIEHSARTMVLRGHKDPEPVLDNLMNVFHLTYGVPHRHAATAATDAGDEQHLAGLMRRFERAVQRLERSTGG
jgi:TetR/AcrR family fatty acid metabolism transcriptional regulator